MEICDGIRHTESYSVLSVLDLWYYCLHIGYGDNLSILGTEPKSDSNIERFRHMDDES